jgi:hypothetical protein
VSEKHYWLLMTWVVLAPVTEKWINLSMAGIALLFAIHSVWTEHRKAA